MKQQPTDKETAKYNAVSSIADLLRETTTKEMVPVEYDAKDNPTCLIDFEYGNKIFSKEEHETVKRTFLRLISEL